jgi:hypothetical protein
MREVHCPAAPFGDVCRGLALSIGPAALAEDGILGPIHHNSSAITSDALMIHPQIEKMARKGCEVVNHHLAPR